MLRNHLALNQLPFTLAASKLNIIRLSIIRAIVLGLLAVATTYGYCTLGANIRLYEITLLLIVYALFSGFTFYRSQRLAYIHENEFTLQLIAEIFFIGLLAFQTGGATNPFVSYFLVPISIAAATLHRNKAALIAGLSILLYSVLLFFYRPLPLFNYSHAEHNTNSSPALSDFSSAALLNNAHYLGMWFNFVVSAMLISWFVAKMAQAIRSQDKTMNAQRESQLQDEQILSIASMSAGTAHELGTPLNSLKLLVDDFETTERQLSESSKNDLLLMKSQIKICEKTLQKLVMTAQQYQLAKKQKLSIGNWLLNCIEQWQPLRPETSVFIRFDTNQHQAIILCDETLRQAMVNLLNNAANASPDFIEIDLTSNSQVQQATIIIRDKGKGIPENILASQGSKMARRQLNNQQVGLGFGIFLSNASINRLGGKLVLNNYLTLNNKTIQGAEVCVSLPILQEF